MALAGHASGSNDGAPSCSESPHPEHIMSNRTAQTSKTPPREKHPSNDKPQDKSQDDNDVGAEDESTDSDADSTTGGKDGGKRGGTKDPKTQR